MMKTMSKGQIFQISAKSIILLALCVTFSREQERPNATGPVYRVGVDRKITGITYPYGSAPTKIEFTGTALLPEAKGVATVRSGHTEIDASFEKLAPPTHFGWQYPTYVLWAITPEGTCQNLGELTLQEPNHARIQATTDLQTFALIVTAEPYPIVRQPSTMVILENHVRADMAGVAVEPNAGLTPGIEYTWPVAPPVQPAGDAAKGSVSLDHTLRALYQAKNAVAIAQLAGASRFASEPLAAADRALAEAQALYVSKRDPKLVIQNAREAIQRADGARTIAERRRLEGGANGSRDMLATHGAGAASHPDPDRPETNQEPLQALSRSLLHEVVDGMFPAQDTQRGLVITLPDTDFDGATLLSTIVQKLGPVASTLTSQQNLHIEVEGYMDSAELASWDRAQSVRNALLSAGLNGNQISMRGGMTKPARPGEDRRVQIVISSGAPAAQIASPSVAGSIASPVAVSAVSTNPEPAAAESPSNASAHSTQVAAVQARLARPVAPSAPPPVRPAPRVEPAVPTQALLVTPVEAAAPPQAPPTPAVQPAVPTQEPPAVPVEAAAPPTPAVEPAVPPQDPPAPPVVATAPPQTPPPAPAAQAAAPEVTPNPKAAAIHQGRGRKLMQEERFEDAIQEFSEAVTLNPSLALAYNGRGYAYYRLKNYQAASGDFDAAIRLDPVYANAYLNRSLCRRALGDKAGAATDAAKARDLTTTTSARSANSGSSPGL
jgi:outer membrane protein OmpA-like peptidoglycan-associated protein